MHDVRDNARLRDSYDLIVMGQQRGDAMTLVRGLQGDDPIPWKATEITPNIGRQASTDDMRGGLGLEGVLHLKEFVEAGGVFVTMAGASSLPIHFGLADGVSIRQTPGLWARGGVFAARVTDQDSPIAYGYDNLGVAFNTAPVFRVGGGGGGFAAFFGGGRRGPQNRGPGDTTARRTGRGGADEDDVVQGRARDLGAAGVEAFRAEQEDDDAPGGGFSFGPNTDHIRVVMRFARRADDLLISGGLEERPGAGQRPGGRRRSAGRRPRRDVLLQPLLALPHTRLVRPPLQHPYAPRRVVGDAGGDDRGGGGRGSTGTAVTRVSSAS